MLEKAQVKMKRTDYKSLSFGQLSAFMLTLPLVGEFVRFKKIK